MKTIETVVPTFPTGLASAFDCRLAAAVPLLPMSRMFHQKGHAVYRMTASQGPVQFRLDRPGLFAVHGLATIYDGTVSIDPTNDHLTGLELGIAPEGLDLTWTNLPLGPGYSGQPIPPTLFRSSGLATTASGRVVLRGLMEFGGRPHLQMLDVLVTDRFHDRARGSDLLSFRLGGRIPLSHLPEQWQHRLAGNAIALSLHLSIERPRPA